MHAARPCRLPLLPRASTRWPTSPPAATASASSTSWAASRARSRRPATSSRAATWSSAPRRAAAGSCSRRHRRHPRVQQRARGTGRRPRLQHRRRLPAALGRARRRRRTDPREPGAAQDRHHHREDRGARCARDPRDGAGRGRRRHRRQLPGRGRLLEPHPHRRRARRRPPGGDAAAGHGRHLLELGRLHDARSRSTSPPKAGARRPWSRRARTSTSTTRRATSRTRCATTGARARPCSTPSPAATTSRTIDFGKPVVACVVGRWKSKLTPRGRPRRRDGRLGRQRRRTRSAGSWRPSASTPSSRPRTRSSRRRARW